MVITDSELLKQIRAGIANPVELERWLINNVPVSQMAHELADFILENRANKPIVLTQEEFEAHFRIRGYRFVEGRWEKETRGREKM